MPHIRTIITFLGTTILLAAIACGAEVRLTPASAQDGTGGAGGETAAGGDDRVCDCPAPPPTIFVELARAECVGGFASFTDVTGPGMRQAVRGGHAWLEATSANPSQRQALLEWDTDRGLFVRCPIGEDMTATLWGLE